MNQMYTHVLVFFGVALLALSAGTLGCGTEDTGPTEDTLDIQQPILLCCFYL